MIPAPVRGAVNKALYLLPHQMHTPEARVCMYAICGQESDFQHRRQIIKKGGQLVPLGPAKGLFQFERGGGCKGVVEHQASRYWMHHVCQARGVAFNPTAIWNAIETDDVLAAAAARLLLFTDPKRLPAVNDESGAWLLYLRTWRPGAWSRGTPEQRRELRAKWAQYHAMARAEVAV